MKKLLFFAAMMLGLASCQTEPEGLGVDMGAQETNITVALPEVTRANSANSGWANTGEDLRVILQVFDENDATNDAMRQVEPLTAGETTVNFNVRLVPGHEYTFVAWADQGAEGEYFNTTNLKNVTFATGAWTAMNEEIDAYTATTTIPAGESIPNVTLSLTRPFAKIRVVTTDIEAIRNLDWDPTTAVASYQVDVPTSFNAFAGTVGTDYVEDPTRNITYKDQNDQYKYNDNTGEMTLYSDYIFIPAAGTVQFGLSVNHAGGEIRTTNFNTEIPAVRNHLTTIKGNILTGDNDINVEVSVDEEFEKENSVFYAFSNGGTVTLDKDYELGSTLYVESGVKATLNLNGKTLKSLYDANNYTDVIVVEAGAELTINGDGTIEAEGGKSNFTVIVDGKLTINGGTFKSGVDEVNDPNAVIYVRGNGEVYVNGGNFPNELNSKYILNKKDGDRATTKIEVRGGRFQNFDPANNAAEGPNTNFLAEGCRVEADSDWFNVIYDPYYGYTKVDNIAQLRAAVAVANSNIAFGENIIVDDNLGAVEISQSVNIDGFGKTFTGDMTLKADVTIKNVNFDGKGFNGYAITTRGASYVTIEDCTAKNYGYGFVQLASGTALTTVKNVTVSNMNYGVKVDYSNAVVIENADITAGVAAVLNSNYGEKSITIKNSKLNILGTWTRNNTFKTNYVFEGNNSIDTFIIDAAIDNFKLAAGATLTAPNAITVTTVDGYRVEYADGKYISKL